MRINMYFNISVIYLATCRVYRPITTITGHLVRDEISLSFVVPSSCRLPSTSSSIDVVPARWLAFLYPAIKTARQGSPLIS